MPPKGGTKVGPFWTHRQISPWLRDAGGVRPERAEVGGLPDGHRGQAVLRGALGDDLGGAQAGDLAETEPAVQADGRAVVAGHGHRRSSGRMSTAGQPGGVHRHQVRAVRVDAAQVGLDQQFGDVTGLVFGDAVAAQDRRRARPEGRRPGTSTSVIGHQAGTSPAIVTRCRVRSAPAVSPTTACWVHRLSQMTRSPTCHLWR